MRLFRGMDLSSLLPLTQHCVRGGNELKIAIYEDDRRVFIACVRGPGHTVFVPNLGRWRTFALPVLARFLPNIKTVSG
jgi:hypothetical protein